MNTLHNITFSLGDDNDKLLACFLLPLFFSFFSLGEVCFVFLTFFWRISIKFRVYQSLYSWQSYKAGMTFTTSWSSPWYFLFLSLIWWVWYFEMTGGVSIRNEANDYHSDIKSVWLLLLMIVEKVGGWWWCVRIRAQQHNFHEQFPIRINLIFWDAPFYYRLALIEKPFNKVSIRPNPFQQVVFFLSLSSFIYSTVFF